MRVLLVNTSDQTGGAAIAAYRLMEALNNNGVKAKMLVRDKRTDNLTVCALPQSPMLKVKFAWERGIIWLHNRLRMKNLWAVDIANTGVDITQLPEFQEADVIHLHWINQGMLSLSDLQKIVSSGKRIVWTLHDQWPYAGICHYSNECDRYQQSCHDCPQLLYPSARDLSCRVFRQKQRLYQSGKITFVGCSQWITSLAEKSALLKGQRILSIPNVVPAQIFHPMNQEDARRQYGLPLDKKLILFCSQKVTDERKGVRYLMEALELLQNEPIRVVVIGKGAEKLQHPLLLPLGTVNGQAKMAALYAAVDAFVTPSLQDNLPNTIAEAMSVGTPCVGFNVGGIPEMIDHRENGYVAQYQDAKDLADGIRFVLSHDLRQATAHKAVQMFDAGSVARQYIQVYEK